MPARDDRSGLTAGHSRLLCLPGSRRIEELGNGLRVCLLHNPQAPLVSTVLWYRVGTRDEDPQRGGAAHFLEHMMFKGSSRYAPGEIDRRTQALGGSNNAFTSHDATAYYFAFACDRWTEALSVESDRMAALTLDSRQVNSERQVILEEIAMYEDDPWDALEMEVQAALFPDHPYGRPVLGTREGLCEIDGAVLGEFHRRFYRPDNAVLLVAGDIDRAALQAVEKAFGELSAGAGQRRRLTPSPPLDGPVRVERRQGDVARLLVAFRGPAAAEPDFAPARLLMAILGTGRASRLQRALVDEGQLASWVSVDMAQMQYPGALTIAVETLPGIDPPRVEEELFRQLRRVAKEPPALHEIERARQIVVADWVFSHERIHQQALILGYYLAVLDSDEPEDHLRRILDSDASRLHAVASRYLEPAAGCIVGWSLPSR